MAKQLKDTFRVADGDHNNDSQSDYISYGSIPEPVTPPTSSHSSVLYPNHQYFPHSQTLASKAQFSPHLTIREHNQTQLNYSNMGPSSLNSPVDAPFYSTLTSQQASYLATPNTPVSTHDESQSIPSTPSSSRPVSLTCGRHSNTGSVNFPSVTPLGHTRSYSYNIRDPQPSLNRLSLSSVASSSSNQENEFRPRAYSSGLASAQMPLIGAMNQTTSTNHSTIENSSSVYPFPPPLSSPISPENLLAMSDRYKHRHQYSQPFTNQTEEQLNSINNNSNNNNTPGGTRSGLQRSLSAVSSLSAFHTSGSRVGQHPLSTNHEELNRDNFGSSKTNASPVSFSARKSSPPSTRTNQQRRSSSGASSASAVDISHGSNNVEISGGILAASKLHGPNIDIASAEDQQIYALCKEQRGCRYLQRKLSEGDPAVIRRVFGATKSNIDTLMMDPFGNYLCQKLFEYCSHEEITQLLMVTAPSLATIAINQHGTRALQKLIDAVSRPEQVEILICALNGHVVRLIRDLNGNHVIQKLLLELDSGGSQFIYDAVCRSVVEIGSHRHGCCVLQRCLDYAQSHNRNNLVTHIVAKAPVLVCDPFGNYVCQYVIDLGVQEYTDSLVNQLLGKISHLSVQKFSSNVVEKCLRAASPRLQQSLITEIMMPRTLHDLLLDNYGNYVIQTALESSSWMDSETKQQLALSIQSALAFTRSPYGRRILSKLKSW